MKAKQFRVDKYVGVSGQHAYSYERTHTYRVRQNSGRLTRQINDIFFFFCYSSKKEFIFILFGQLLFITYIYVCIQTALISLRSKCRRLARDYSCVYRRKFNLFFSWIESALNLWFLSYFAARFFRRTTKWSANPNNIHINTHNTEEYWASKLNDRLFTRYSNMNGAEQ